MAKIIKLNYLNTETWSLHIVVDEDATTEEIVAAAEMALEDGNFFENAASGGDNTTRFMSFKQVLDGGGDYVYTVEDGELWEYDGQE